MDLKFKLGTSRSISEEPIENGSVLFDKNGKIYIDDGTERKVVGEKNTAVDQTYSAISENAQSGTAVAEAIAKIPIDQTYIEGSRNPQSATAVQQAIDKSLNEFNPEIDIVIDQIYDPTSPNAQSGIAVKQAIDDALEEYTPDPGGGSGVGETTVINEQEPTIRGERFNDYDEDNGNRALAPGSHAEGTRSIEIEQSGVRTTTIPNIAGCKCFQIKSSKVAPSDRVAIYYNPEIDADSKLIIVNGDASKCYSENDVVSIITNQNFDECAVIDSIRYNESQGTTTIFLKNWPSSDLTSGSSVKSTTPMTLRVPAKPLAGDMYIGLGAHSEGVGSQALADGAHAEGRETKAVGRYAHTEGRGTKAQYAGHAEGENTFAGFKAHAEGQNTSAIGKYAHSEGYNTEAQGISTHAEGGSTRAIGKYSHSEGYNTETQGEFAHAEGQDTEASGQYAHSEGCKTKAQGEAAHAEGQNTEAIGGKTHAEGSNTKAQGEAAHAEGSLTQALQNGSHAEGYGTNNIPVIANGLGAHAEGIRTEAANNGAHAEGADTMAEGSRAHAEGNQTCAFGFAAHAEGSANGADTSALRDKQKIYGAFGDFSHSEGNMTKAMGVASHAEGYGTIAQNDYSHAEGKYNIYDNQLISLWSRNKFRSDDEYYINYSNKADCQFDDDNNFSYASYTTNNTIKPLLTPISHTDTGITSESKDTFENGVKLYPNSQYRIIVDYIGGQYSATKFEIFSGGAIDNNIAGGKNQITDVTTVYGEIDDTNNRITAEITFIYPKDRDVQNLFIRPNYSSNAAKLQINSIAIYKEIPLLHSIGNGTSDEDRSNAFAVYQDGHAEIQTVSDTPNSVVTREYVDKNNFGEIEDTLEGRTIIIPNVGSEGEFVLRRQDDFNNTLTLTQNKASLSGKEAAEIASGEYKFIVSNTNVAGYNISYFESPTDLGLTRLLGVATPLEEADLPGEYEGYATIVPYQAVNKKYVDDITSTLATQEQIGKIEEALTIIEEIQNKYINGDVE